MKILFVLDQPWDSALTDYAFKIYLQALKNNNVKALCLKDSYIEKKINEPIYTPILRTKNPFLGLKGFFKFYRILKEIKPEIVVTIWGDATFFACLLKKSLNFKLIRIFAQQKELRSPPNCVDRVIIPCEYLKEYISERRVGDVVVFKSFVDREKYKFSPEGRKKIREQLNIENNTVFGAVGRLDRVKGFDLLIESFAKASLNNSKLIIVGEEKGVKKEKLLNLAKDFGIEEKFILISERRDDIVDIMSAFDIGVISSIDSEVIPRVFFEFMSIGLPILTTDVGCLKEVAEEDFSVISQPIVYSFKKGFQTIYKRDLVKMSSSALKEAEKYAISDINSLFEI